MKSKLKELIRALRGEEVLSTALYNTNEDGYLYLCDFRVSISSELIFFLFDSQFFPYAQSEYLVEFVAVSSARRNPIYIHLHHDIWIMHAVYVCGQTCASWTENWAHTFLVFLRSWKQLFFSLEGCD